MCSADGVSVSTGLSCASVSSKDHPLYTDKLQPCEGQSSCLVHGIHDELPLGSQPGDSGCTLSETDSLFVQYSCVIPDDELKIKRHQALVASCINIFAALTLLSVIANRQGSIAIEKKEWDLQTVTASDYCLELSLSIEQVDELRNELNSERFLPRESDGLRLKLYLIKKLEEILKQLSGDDGGKIADINFAYYNSWLLDGLRERGDAIKY